MAPTRLLAGLMLAGAFLLTSAPVALASAEVDSAAAELRGGESVYSDPAAENALSDSEVESLTSQISATGLPLYIAVLPESTGDAEAVLVELKDAIGMSGIYAVVVGNKFRAASTDGSAADLATSAFRSQKEYGVAAVLTEFVALADVEFNGDATGSTENSTENTVFGLILGLIFCVGLPIALIVFVIVYFVRKSKRNAQDLAEVKAAVEQDVTEFGERLAAFDMTNPAIDDAGRADLQTALDSYDKAKGAADRLRGAAYASLVTAPLEEGRFALACVQARLDGAELPERRAPCFIDPRHGPSVAEVMWSAPGLDARELPMCAACKMAVQSGGSPIAREVDSRSGSQPYWMAGPQYAQYARGYYSAYDTSMITVWGGTMFDTTSRSSNSRRRSGGTNWGSDTSGGDFGSGRGPGGGDFGGGGRRGGGGGGSRSGGGDF
jgi:hypothetical protein